MRLFFALILGALLIALISGASLTYDGSYYLYRTLEDQQPFVPNRRLVHGILLTPVLIGNHFTGNIKALSTIFGLVYVSIPLIAFLLAWWIVAPLASARGLFVWVAFGIGIATLPGQIVFISEGAQALQLFWALFLASIIGIRRRHLIALVPIGIFIFIAHPSATILFGIVAAVSFITGWRIPNERRQRWGWAAAFLVIAIVAAIRFALTINPYEAEQLSLAILWTRFTSSVLGLQLVTLLLGTFAGITLVLPRFKRFSTYSNRIQRWGKWSLIVSMVTLVIWALIPFFWIDALSYRFFIIPFSLPFMGLALVDYLSNGEKSHTLTKAKATPGENRNVVSGRQTAPMIPVLQVLAATFALVVSIQSIWWLLLSNQLLTTLEQSKSACISLASEELTRFTTTALQHWSIVPYSLILQAPTPIAVALYDSKCNEVNFQQGLPIAYWDLRQWQGGWLDLHQLQARLSSK